MNRFLVEMLPARDGDCLLISWGDDQRLTHMVVDGGRTSAYPHLRTRLATIAEAGEEVALYVLTHIDADHIEGALAYLKDKQRPLVPKRTWFNGYRQMMPRGRRSMRQGEEYSKALEKLGWPMNEEFTNGVASLENAPASIDVDGLRITLLSPDDSHLLALGADWRRFNERLAAKEEAKARDGMRGGGGRPPLPSPLVVEDLAADGETDKELPNGTSIAFVAEWNERRVLLGGDAHPDLLTASLRSLTAEAGGRYRVDLYKASHHGSRNNTSRELVQIMDCRRMALSSDGSHHGHPDPQAIARFIHYGPEGPKMLYFNYATPRTEPWGDQATMEKYDYGTRYPTIEAGGLTINVMAAA